VTLCAIPSPCGVLSPCGHFSPNPCGSLPSQCGPISPGCGFSVIPEGDPLGSLQQLAVLKEQLRQGLKQVEEAEKALTEAVKPQSLDQIADLEKRMASALEELKARRDELSKKK
jgi:hypothetical protein